MSNKKFGTFSGVFTPSILTILGVIMYMRLGWVVGNAGLWGTIAIILIAHIISVTTGLSISAIATDKKVGAGGVYYVLSRSLGLPIGGAIGLTLFVGTAFSIALYLIGFAESLNAYWGFGLAINDLRITASLAMLFLTIIAFISTSVALKTQFFIFAAIVLSLVSIFWGTAEFAPQEIVFWASEKSVPLEQVFAIFFPAVTGFTAGIAMSGDLKNGKNAIPLGTMLSIGVGLLVYIVLAIFIAFRVETNLLLTDNNILLKIAFYSPIVVLGVWGATLSSALGGILGAPRVLQAMSLDRITPKIFGKGIGKANEPRNALLLTALIAQAGILIGELDLIASLVSMFFLTAYGFINLSFFLESWASADFNPVFKVKKWIGLLGFIATFAVMSKLNMGAMFGSFIVVGMIFLWLTKKQVALGTGDIWQSVWASVVKIGLQKMATGEDHIRNWKPNLLIFTGRTSLRPALLEFGKSLIGQTGLATNFDLIENRDAGTLFTKNKQAFQDISLKELGIFGRRVEVNNLFRGIEAIATTFGFSGLDPNTVLMGWAKNTKDPIWFAEMTQKLINLDYNVLYLDYDKRYGFRKQKTIDLWWRGYSSNTELTLIIAKFITSSPDWHQPQIRVLLADTLNINQSVIRNRIQKLLNSFRVQAEIIIINNEIEQKSIYDLMKIHSGQADLVVLGIPNVIKGKESEFVDQTNNLVNTIGTTLLVKASSDFQVVDFGTRKIESNALEFTPKENLALPQLYISDCKEVNQLSQTLNLQFETIIRDFSEDALRPISEQYLQFAGNFELAFEHLFQKINNTNSPHRVRKEILELIKKLPQISVDFKQKELESLSAVFAENLLKYQEQRHEIIALFPKKVTRKLSKKELEVLSSDNPLLRRKKRSKKFWKKALKIQPKTNIAAQEILQLFEENQSTKNVHKAFLDFGFQNLEMLFTLKKIVNEHLQLMSNEMIAISGQQNSLSQSKEELEKLQKSTAVYQEKIRKEIEKAKQLSEALFSKFHQKIRRNDVELCNDFSKFAIRLDALSEAQKTIVKIKPKQQKKYKQQNSNFPNDWLRNQRLLHAQLETSLQLENLVFSLQQLSQNAMQKIKKSFWQNIYQNTISFQKEVTLIKETLAKNERINLSEKRFQFEEFLGDTESIINELQNRQQALLSIFPEEITLFDAQTSNNFRNAQSDETQTIELLISNIVDYIALNNYIAPFREILEKISLDSQELDNRLRNAAILLEYGINARKKDVNYNISEIINKTEKEINDILENLEFSQVAFKENLQQKVAAVAAELSIFNIIERADQLLQYVKEEERNLHFITWLEKQRKHLYKGATNIVKIITNTQEEVAKAKLQNKNKNLLPMHVQIRDFVADFTLSEQLETALPFYYKQLFTGKHLSVQKVSSVRTQQITEAKETIQNIIDGAAGALLVTGAAQTGKSFFVEHIAHQNKVNKIVPIVFSLAIPKGANTIENAFQAALYKDGKMNVLMREIPTKTIFIIEDIEELFLKNNEDLLFQELIMLIERYSKRHIFILSANLHAYKMLLLHSSLKRCLLNTIILPPIRTEDLVKIIWARHKTGGFKITHKGSPADQLSNKNLEKIFQKIAKSSQKNIGIALHQWLLGIQSLENETIEIDFVNFNGFPSIAQIDWKSLLFRFIMHKTLTRSQILSFYEEKGKQQSSDFIATLLKSGLVEQPVRSVYRLKPQLKPYIENAVFEQKIN